MASEHSHLQRCMEKDCAHPIAAETPMAGAGEDGPLAASVSISLEAEVPEVLFDGMREFLENHPQWDQYVSARRFFVSERLRRSGRDPALPQRPVPAPLRLPWPWAVQAKKKAEGPTSA
jgi:hypothetical protein